MIKLTHVHVGGMKTLCSAAAAQTVKPPAGDFRQSSLQHIDAASSLLIISKDTKCVTRLLCYVFAKQVAWLVSPAMLLTLTLPELDACERGEKIPKIISQVWT